MTPLVEAISSARLLGSWMISGVGRFSDRSAPGKCGIDFKRVRFDLPIVEDSACCVVFNSCSSSVVSSSSSDSMTIATDWGPSGGVLGGVGGP